MAKRLGNKAHTSVSICMDRAPAPGEVLQADSNAAREGQWGKVGRESVVEADFPDWATGHFGRGEDGLCDFDGTTPVAGITPSGSVYTLTAEIAATIIHVRSGVTVKTKGYRVEACDEAHLWGTAIVHNDGEDGGAGTDPTGGSKQAVGTTGTTMGGESAGNGGAGGAAGTNNAAAGATGESSSGASSKGGNGAAGGAGGTAATSGFAGGAGGAAGTVTSAKARIDNFANGRQLLSGSFTSRAPVGITGGAGGGGGGGGGAEAADTGKGGGAGGNGGGGLFLVARKFVLHSWTGRISANGGAGGAGAEGATGPGVGASGGGGGGGGGGYVVVQCVSVEDGVLHPGVNVTADGGTAGSAGGPDATNGGAGVGGTVSFLCLTQRFQPTAEQLSVRDDEEAMMAVAVEVAEAEAGWEDFYNYESGTGFDQA